jgi:hypothetical protein
MKRRAPLRATAIGSPAGSGRSRVAVIVRVHDRMADLEVCLEVLRRHWTRHDYRVIVVSNGRIRGFKVPPRVRGLAGQVVELAHNAGHLAGNSQLLREGVRHAGKDAEFAVLLEADTWVFSDRLVDRYLRRMRETGAVWASSEWYDRWHSLGLDLAIVRMDFLKGHPDLFDFTDRAEAHVCNVLRRVGARYLVMGECSPVHMPYFARVFLRPRDGHRVQAFSRVPMVTHHVERLAGGMEEKKAFANLILGRREFDVPPGVGTGWTRAGYLLHEWFLRWAPRSSWFKGKLTDDA